MSRTLDLIGFGPEGWGNQFIQGASITLALALITLPLASFLGLLVAVSERGKSTWVRALCRLYTTIFRALPELLTLFLVAFGTPILWKALRLPGELNLPPFLSGIIALSLVSAAFASELWRGAFKAISTGQSEAAYALGLSRTVTFFFVVFPQLLRVALPGIGNNWMYLLKDTSLVSAIAVHDLMFVASSGSGTTKQPLLFFSVALGIYLFFSLLSSFFFMKLERRTNLAYLGGRS